MVDKYSFSRYLSAKVSVDDRSLNNHVWETFRDHLKERNISRVIEPGAGIGTMFIRLLRRGLPLAGVDYFGLDLGYDLTEAASKYVASWLADNQIPHRQIDSGTLEIERPAGSLRFLSRHGDILKTEPSVLGQFDVMIAHAVLDLFNLNTALPHLIRFLRPGGMFYFTINFDGMTSFVPAIDRDYDHFIESLYHHTMDLRTTDGRLSGDSQTGRNLYHQLRRCNLTVLAAGSSDWLVIPDPKGGYPADEAYFLHFIVQTVESALRDHPALGPQERFLDWIAERHRQIDDGELVYIAHQIDYAGTLSS